MNDFREFQKQYNDYLQHGLPYAEDYICHFGILGMKWGVRRYQNPDGTLTTAGKKRYNHLNARANLAEGYVKDLKDMQEGYKEGTLKKGPSDKEIQKYSEFAEKQRQKAEKYGNETPVEKAGRQITNYVNFEKENGFKKANWDPNVSVKTSTVKDSNGKNKKIDFCIDFDTDLEEIGDNSKDVKNTFDNFEKYYSQHEIEIKRQAKEQILSKIKEYSLGPEDTEYFTKMANNIGNRGFMQVRYYKPDQVTIDIDDGVDDLFLPSIDYDINKQKVGHIRMND